MSSDSKNRETSGSPQVYDLYSNLFSKPSVEVRDSSASEGGLPPAQSAPAPSPRSPRNLAESGLTLGQLCDLVLKTLYAQGILYGGDISRLTRLPFSIVDESLRALRDQKLVEVASGDLVGRISYRFALTELGRSRARDTFENCRYIGPAPVPLEQYIEHCRLQHVTGTPCTPAALRRAFTEFVIRPSMLDELGPASLQRKIDLCLRTSGKRENGHRKGLGRFLNLFGGEIYVPYAILAENSIVTVFDPGIHRTTDDADLTQRGMVSSSTEQSSYMVHEGPVDLRWRRIKRPVVITGGELTLDMLELQYSKDGKFL